jgi:hypothetical protein
MEDTTGVLENKQLRFGGVSPTVLRELSGVYQPFVKAVKELLSNAYDADASIVKMEFSQDFTSLNIEDNGIGMNPIEFIHQYIRIGKSYIEKAEHTPKYLRPRIGGKGIGFLAPARYCQRLQIITKKNEISKNYFKINNNLDSSIDLKPLFLQGHGEEQILEHINIYKITDELGKEIPKYIIEDFVLHLDEIIENINIWYEFDSRRLELRALIDFELLFSLDPSKSLEDIDNFCDFFIHEVDETQIDQSYTEVTLIDIRDFTRAELFKTGKKGAKNIESSSGINQFLWNLSRIIPVEAKLKEKLPSNIKELIRNDIDKTLGSENFNVFCSYNGNIDVPLKRFIVEPTRNMDSNTDSDLFKVISINDRKFNYEIKGFIIGQNSTIYPGEARGILLRVKGVAVGEPTYFGLDQLLTGASKVALTQVSGEINFINGIDAIHDINPGRDGFYKESKVFNYLKQILVGDNPEKPTGLLKDVIDSIVVRSEMNASINNFRKKHESQRKSIFEISTSLSAAAFEDPFINDNFFMDKESYELLLQPVVKYKAEGKLASFIVELVVSNNSEEYTIDFVNKKLLLNKNADLWKKNVNIGGVDFEIIFKHGKKLKILCEVHSSQNKIYLNWDHPIKSTMSDGDFIKHCLAVVASDLPQEKLNTYNEIFGYKNR